MCHSERSADGLRLGATRLKPLLVIFAIWGMITCPAQAALVNVTGQVRGVLPAGVTVVVLQDGAELSEASVESNGKFRVQFDERYGDRALCIDILGAFAQSQYCIDDPMAAQNPRGSISGVDLRATDQATRRSEDFNLIKALIDSADYETAEAKLFSSNAKRLGYFESLQFYTLWSDLVFAAFENQEELQPQTVDVAARLEDDSDIAVAFSGLEPDDQFKRVQLFFNALQQGRRHNDGFPDRRSDRRTFNLVIDIAALALRQGNPVLLFEVSSRFCMRKLPPTGLLGCLEAILSAAGSDTHLGTTQPTDPLRDALVQYLRNCLEALPIATARMLVDEGQRGELENFVIRVENTLAQSSDQQVREASQNLVRNMQSALAN